MSYKAWGWPHCCLGEFRIAGFPVSLSQFALEHNLEQPEASCLCSHNAIIALQIHSLVQAGGTPAQAGAARSERAPGAHALPCRARWVSLIIVI